MVTRQHHSSIVISDTVYMHSLDDMKSLSAKATHTRVCSSVACYTWPNTSNKPRNADLEKA